MSRSDSPFSELHCWLVGRIAATAAEPPFVFHRTRTALMSAFMPMMTLLLLPFLLLGLLSSLPPSTHRTSLASPPRALSS